MVTRVGTTRCGRRGERQRAAGVGRGRQLVRAVDRQAGGEVRAVGEAGGVDAATVDRQPGAQVGHHRVDEAHVVGGHGRAGIGARRELRGVDLLGEVEGVPLGGQAAGVQDAIAQPGREHRDQPGRVGLLAPAGHAQELLAGAAAAMEHEHDGPPGACGWRGLRHVDEETSRVAIELDGAAVDALRVREADGAVGRAGRRRLRARGCGRGDGECADRGRGGEQAAASGAPPVWGGADAGSVHGATVAAAARANHPGDPLACPLDSGHRAWY